VKFKKQNPIINPVIVVIFSNVIREFSFTGDQRMNTPNMYNATKEEKIK
jgi:hypothetical protein